MQTAKNIEQNDLKMLNDSGFHMSPLAAPPAESWPANTRATCSSTGERKISQYNIQGTVK